MFKNIDELTSRIIHQWIKEGCHGTRETYIRETVRDWVRSARKSQWPKLRGEVFKRDSHICDVCRSPIHIEQYECGHIVDRVIGGEDDLDNLVAMHDICNRVKPLHYSRDEYEAWRKGAEPLLRALVEYRDSYDSKRQRHE